MTFSLNLKYMYGEKAKGHINTQREFSEQLFKSEIVKLFDSIDTHPLHDLVQVNITLSNFRENKHTTSNLFTLEEDTKQAKLTASIQNLRDKFGIDILKSGGEL